jgi:hypothetical protein
VTDAERKRGHAEARRLWPSPLGCCEYLGCERPARDRHHVDGDPAHNVRANVAFLCRRHHMEVDGRLAAVRASAPTLVPPQDAKRCENCGRPYKPLRCARCQPCAVYRRKFGRERPYRQDGRRERFISEVG